MHRFWKTAVVVLALSHASCGPHADEIQVVVANTVARAANAGLPALVEAERQQGMLAIQGSADRETARAKLTQIEHDWAPVWLAWKALSVAQGAWATALEHGGDKVTAALAVRDAFCKLRALPLAAQYVPEASGLLCPPPGGS
jgi:hypothetical protein